MSHPSAQSLQAPPHVLALLSRLHTQSLEEESQLSSTWATIRTAASTSTPQEYASLLDSHMADKMIALDADKAAFVYTLIRAMRATRVVEVGSSFGVSTIYLALAVGQNVQLLGGEQEGRVVATEWEAGKVAKARANWKEAGLEVERWIDLREGDLRETLKVGLSERSVEVVLFDIWTPLVVPALDILEPSLVPGAVLLVDNTIRAADGYAEFFARVRAPDAPYRTLTLPFDGGFDVITYDPKQ